MMICAMTTAPRKLRELRDRAGLTMDQLAKLAGYRGASSIQRYESDEYAEKGLPVNFVRKAMPALIGKGVHPITQKEVIELASDYDMIIFDEAHNTARTVELKKIPSTQVGSNLGLTATPFSALPSANVDLSTVQTEGLVGARDVPVYASARGGHGEMIMDFDPIEWVRRPQPLMNVKGGYAVYVVGDSMEPAYEPGDMILCHPSKPALANDDVLIVMRRQNGDQEAMVKRFLCMTDDELRLMQWNPKRDITVPRAQVQSVHVVVGKYRRR